MEHSYFRRGHWLSSRCNSIVMYHPVLVSTIRSWFPVEWTHQNGTLILSKWNTHQNGTLILSKGNTHIKRNTHRNPPNLTSFNAFVVIMNVLHFTFFKRTRRNSSKGTLIQMEHSYYQKEHSYYQKEYSSSKLNTHIIKRNPHIKYINTQKQLILSK